MADFLTSTEQIIRLSSIDQSLSRVYIRLALCYEYNNANVLALSLNLTPAVKRTVTQFPILAGTVRPATDEENGQQGRLEVAVTLDQVNTFKPKLKSVIGLQVKSYDALSSARMPAYDLINNLIVPLPDLPTNSGDPAFAVQATLISGGLVVALYLHHSVGDFSTLRSIINHISSNSPFPNLTPTDLKEYAHEQSNLRHRLSSSMGVRPEPAQVSRLGNISIMATPQLMAPFNMAAPGNDCCIFCFNLGLLSAVQAHVADRSSRTSSPPPLQMSTLDVLAAILWKSITRARVNRGQVNIDESEAMQQTSTLHIPVGFRNKIEKPIDSTYFGNTVVQVSTTELIHKLAMPLEPINIEKTAQAIRRVTSTVDERHVRSTIANINESADASEVMINGMVVASDLAIMSWVDLTLKGSTLSLGLGEPAWARQIGRSMDTFVGCIVHNKREGEGLWDVMIQLPHSTMCRLKEDPGFMEYVACYA
jgi:hypothetical protein